MTPNLYICSTYYHVYITLCKVMTQKQQVDLIICDDIPAGEELSSRLRDSGIFQKVWFVRQNDFPEIRGKNKLDWIFCQHKRRKKIIDRLLPTDFRAYTDIYIFHDGTPIGMYLNDAHIFYHLIEDSLNIYQRLYDTAQKNFLKPHNLKFYIRRFLQSGYFPFGDSKYVRDIEVNQNRTLQVRHKKIIELPREQIEQKLTDSQRKEILNIFGCQNEISVPAHSALLLTEPFYADGICESEEEQLEIYRKLCSQLQREGWVVFLKPHPRDQVDYDDLRLPSLNAQFPIELLNYFLGISFDCAAAVSSSAIFTLKNVPHRFWWKQDKLIPAKI